MSSYYYGYIIDDNSYTSYYDDYEAVSTTVSVISGDDLTKSGATNQHIHIPPSNYEMEENESERPNEGEDGLKVRRSYLDELPLVMSSSIHKMSKLINYLKSLAPS